MDYSDLYEATGNDPSPQERWVPIRGFLNYEVSDRGRIRNVDRGQYLSLAVRREGIFVGLNKNNVRYCRSVAKLVAEAFVPTMGKNSVGLVTDTVVHKDGDRHNNYASNLMWVTRSQAIRHHKKWGE